MNESVSFTGYTTDMMYFPEHKIAVAVQVNTSLGRDLGKPLGRVLSEIAEQVIRSTSADAAACSGI